MMYYMRDDEPVGVLNDFDLASVMNVGERTAAQKGLECAGTVSFMAMELLRFPNGEIGRRFRHDLESTTWCLAWQMANEISTKWYEGDFVSVRQFKAEFMSEHLSSDFKVEWLPYYGFLTICFEKWESYLRSMIVLVRSKGGVDEIKYRTEEHEKASEKDFLEPDIKEAKALKDVEIVEALEDLSWMDVSLVDA